MTENTSYILFEFIKLIGILFAVRAFVINKKLLYLSTINNCVNQFRQTPSIKKDSTDIDSIANYIDLVNMELFYFQYNYLPKEICDEWLDGIINVMSLFDKHGNVLNSEYVNASLVNNHAQLLANFPRIRKVLTVSAKYDINLLYSQNVENTRYRQTLRRKLILELMGNLKLYRWYDFEYKRKVLNFI